MQSFVKDSSFVHGDVCTSCSQQHQQYPRILVFTGYRDASCSMDQGKSFQQPGRSNADLISDLIGLDGGAMLAAVQLSSCFAGQARSPCNVHEAHTVAIQHSTSEAQSLQGQRYLSSAGDQCPSPPELQMGNTARLTLSEVRVTC